MPEGTERVIRASEVAQYVYCAHAWWLSSVEGLPSAHIQEMRSGTVWHRHHGRRVRSAGMIARLAYLSLALAVLVALIGLIQTMVSG